MAPMWDRIDPLAEKYYGISPYAYCGGDPVNFGDYEGMEPTKEEAARMRAKPYGDYSGTIGGGWIYSSINERLDVTKNQSDFYGEVYKPCSFNTGVGNFSK